MRNHLLQDDRCVVTAPLKALCPEDDDFMAALDRMVAENIHERDKEGQTNQTKEQSSQ